jgi:hypothetical protein
MEGRFRILEIQPVDESDDSEGSEESDEEDDMLFPTFPIANKEEFDLFLTLIRNQRYRLSMVIKNLKDFQY